MSKTSLFATSLIGAIPGAFLAYLCVMAFMNYAGGGSVLLKATTGLLLVVGLTMPVLSVLALLSGREAKPKAAKKKEDKKADKKGKKSDDAEEELVASDSESALTGEVANTDELMDMDDADIGDDVFADEEPEEPAKKKKKKS
ncbi:MAG: hypothetical protein NT069_29590 [Planctomycetota bacterium]|nr:hypothetical protein [Planctomycetota bacterium]